MGTFVNSNDRSHLNEVTVFQNDYGSIHSTTNRTTISNATAEGAPYEMRMSPIRRTFCLFVLFDFILTFVIWVIYTQLIGFTGLKSAFEEQVVQYSFRTSLFDTVIIAFVRCAFIELLYAIINAQRAWWIAFPTLTTSIFVLVKIFFYDFAHRDASLRNTDKNALDYVMILICFCFCWLETWFLDFRVLPRERVARYELEQSTSLPHPGVLAPSLYVHSERYWSPQESLAGDDDDERPLISDTEPLANQSGFASPIESRPASPTNWDLDHVMRKAEEIERLAEDLLRQDVTESWKQESNDPHKGIVYSRANSGPGRTYRLQGRISIQADKLFEDVVMNVVNTPQWNRTVSQVLFIEKITDAVDVVYSVAAEAAGGVISSRDFVTLRIMRTLDSGELVSYSASIKHPDHPPLKQFVRGENGPSCFSFVPCEDDSESCEFTVILNTDLKGWIPSYVVDAAMTGVLQDLLKCVRQRALQLCDTDHFLSDVEDDHDHQ